MTGRSNLYLALAVGTLAAAPYIAAAIEATQSELLMMCDRPLTPDGSDYDTGEASMRWLPPGVRCTWDGRAEPDEFFPTYGTVLVAGGLLASEGAVLGAAVLLRRRRAAPGSTPSAP